MTGFVALEGGEGAGKSTQAARLAGAFGAVLVREPGGTGPGEAVRSLLLDPATGDLDPRAETLLFAAARAQLVADVIEPALAAGRRVVADRFTGSTLAYQGFGRGLDVDRVAEVCAWAAAGRWPDLIVLLDLDPEVAATRLAGAPDRMESAGDDFHRRVTAGFRTLAGRDPGRWAVVDAAGGPDEVAGRVAAVVADRLGWVP